MTDLERYIARVNEAYRAGRITKAKRDNLIEAARKRANAKGEFGPQDRDELNAKFNESLSTANPGGGGGGGGQTGGGGGNSRPPAPGSAWIWDSSINKWIKPGRPGFDSSQGSYTWDDNQGWVWVPKQQQRPPQPGAAWVWNDSTQSWVQPPMPTDGRQYRWDDNQGWIPVEEETNEEDDQTDEENDQADDGTGGESQRDREAREQRERQTAESYLTELLSEYGLTDLIPAVSDLIKEWGTNTNIVVSKLRQTEQYKERFRGNEYRIKNGYNAMSEAEYLSTEDAIRSTMRRYGLTGDYYSRDKLATLIGGDVSPTEVDGRIGQAKKVIDNADPNIRNALVRMYGVGMADMLGYVLAPETALEVVQRRVNAGFASGIALGQGIDLGDTSFAEQIGDLTYGDERTLRAQFDNIGTLAKSTRRLSAIEDAKITDRQVVAGEFGIDGDAAQTVKRLQSRERARFSGQSSTTSNTLTGRGV